MPDYAIETYDDRNVRTKAAEIESFDPATGALAVACRDPGGGKARLSRGWARPGDALAVYDAATLLPKGRLAVTSWRNSDRRPVRLHHCDDVSFPHIPFDPTP